MIAFMVENREIALQAQAIARPDPAPILRQCVLARSNGSVLVV
jgi:hypothetical protein